MADPEGGPDKGPEKPPGRPWTPGEMESFVEALGVIADRLADKYIAFEREKWLHEVPWRTRSRRRIGRSSPS